jgi:hypothetical protein
MMLIKSGWGHARHPSHHATSPGIILMLLLTFLYCNALASPTEAEEMSIEDPFDSENNYEKDLNFDFNEHDIIDPLEQVVIDMPPYLVNLTEEQAYLYNRFSASKLVNNPYDDLDISQSNLSIPEQYNA